MTIIRMMNAKGKAARIAPICKPFNPPDHNKTVAATNWMTPHVNLIELGGFRFPWVVKVPRTKVAESAEMIKKVANKKIAITDDHIPRRPEDKAIQMSSVGRVN